MATIVSAPLDWSQCTAVERIPGKVGGAWLFKNTRTPVSLVFDNLEAGMIIEEITEQQINAALEFAARSAATANRFVNFPQFHEPAFALPALLNPS